jgi:hypothetical protein
VLEAPERCPAGRMADDEHPPIAHPGPLVFWWCRADAVAALAPDLSCRQSGVAAGFLGELDAGGEAEFGVDVGEVGLHGAW